MQIAKSVNEFTASQVANLREHHGEQSVTRDVERHAEKKVGAPLVKLTTERAFLFAAGRIRGGGNVELKKRVTGRQGHRFDLGGVPGSNDESSTIGVGFDLFDDA